MSGILKNINAEKLQGNLSIPSVSATTISGDTFFGDGSNLSGVLTGVTATSPTENSYLLFKNDTWSATTELNIYMNFESPDSYDYITPYNMVVDSFTGSTAMTITLTYTGNTYTLGTTLPQFSTLNVDTDTAGLVLLNGRRL